MYRGPAYTGRSKATPSTTCQKCLKKDMRIPARFRRPDPTDTSLRHYSYECKASTQERPYVSRPSRTQQLFNPKLKPQLTSDVPNDLLRKYVHSSPWSWPNGADMLPGRASQTKP